MRLSFAICFTTAVALCTPACAPEDQPAAPAASAPIGTLPPSAEVMALWARSCALCHVDGNGGAPVVGDAAAWAPRLARGEEALLKSTLEGLNNMPPLGYCMACEADDFTAMIRYMTQGGGR